MLVATEPPEEPDYWEEREASKRLTPTYVSNIYVQPAGGGMVRLNFGAAMDLDPTYHTALVMSADNAREFAKLIYQIAIALSPEPDAIQGSGNVES